MALSPSPRTKKPTPPRWRRRSEARPEEILDAALQEFTERGFEAARMEDVAKRAGLSKAGVYLYFPSKTALLEALIEARIAPFARQAQALAAQGGDNPLEALRLIARIGAHKLSDPAMLAVPRLIIGLAGRFPDIADYYRTHVAEIALAALESLFAQAMDKGLVRRLDTRAAARAFIGPLFLEAMWAHVLRGESAFAQPEALIAQHFDILLNGLEHRA